MTFKRLRLGQKGEALAEEFLIDQGYRIVERNFKNKLGEIDIIAQDDETLCFVEVRTRTSVWHGHPFESVTKSKQRKLTQVALSYMKYKNLTEIHARFDCIAIIPQEQGHSIEIIKNAFEVV